MYTFILLMAVVGVHNDVYTAAQAGIDELTNPVSEE
jgi:hypothetical protein